jgi:DNA-binding response OmpR family regulator
VTGAEGARGGDRADLRILVVDDDPAMVRLVEHILRAHGWPAPTHVATGGEAIEAAARADIVLLDHQLPDLGGLAVLEAIRARGRPPGVILVTAHGSESLAARALRQGADDYLAKDGSFAELLPQVLERVRRARALSDALATAERELVRAERLAAIGEMTVTLHHEINNPLMAASAEVELLLADAGETDTPVRQGLAAIKRSLDRIRDTLKRVRELRAAQSTEYLAGLRMIDLDGAAGAPGVERGRAALYVADEEIARVSSLLLGTAGFRVERCASPADLARAAQSPGLTLALVAGMDALAGFRPPSDRRFKVIALVQGDGAAARAAGADHVMGLPFDPGTFVAETLRVLAE